MARPMRVFVGVVLAVSCAGWTATELLQNSLETGRLPGPYASPQPADLPDCVPEDDVDAALCVVSPGENCEEVAARLRREQPIGGGSRTAVAVSCGKSAPRGSGG